MIPMLIATITDMSTTATAVTITALSITVKETKINL